MAMQTIPVQTQLNADGSLQYLKYKYKGSTVKINFGFDKNGQLVRVDIPQFLNIPHVKLFEIISAMFIQSSRNLYFNAAAFQSVNSMAFEDIIQAVEDAYVQNLHDAIGETVIRTEGVTITN